MPNRPERVFSALGGAHLGDQESKVKLTPRSWGGKLSREPKNGLWGPLIRPRGWLEVWCMRLHTVSRTELSR